jgi:hypothetical protein
MVLDVVQLEVVLPQLERGAKLTLDSTSIHDLGFRSEHRVDADTFLKRNKKA